MKVLLTGSTGFLGKYIASYFKEINISFLTIGRSECDIYYDFESIVSTIPKVDCVIHCAGTAHKNFTSLNSQIEFNKFNYTSVLSMIRSLESSNSKPKKFILISSVSVYGLSSGININEYTQLNAYEPYGRSKINAEKIILDWCSKNDIICTILRLPLVIGIDPPGNLGSMILGIKKGYYFNISGGTARKSMVLAIDVAKFILKAATVGGTFNLTDGYHPTFNELSRIISLQLGKKFVPNMPLFFAKFLAKIGDLIGDKFPINSNKLSKIMSPLTFDDSKARDAFGWDPSLVLEEFKIEDND